MSIHAKVRDAEQQVDAVEALITALIEQAERRIRVDFEAKLAADRATISALQERVSRLEAEAAQPRGWFR